MNSITITKKYIPPILFDVTALVGVYLLPAFAHLLSIPVYMIEPMRVVLILAVVHTSWQNVMLLAITLPLCSFILSGHPQGLKAAIITFELLSNAMVFYFLTTKIKSQFLSMFLAIISSKLLCYMLYWAIFDWSFVIGESAPMFLFIQLITTLIFSIYVELKGVKK